MGVSILLAHGVASCIVAGRAFYREFYLSARLGIQIGISMSKPAHRMAGLLPAANIKSHVASCGEEQQKEWFVVFSSSFVRSCRAVPALAF